MANFDKNEGLMIDAFNADLWGWWISGMNLHKVVTENLHPQSWMVWFRMAKAWPMFWREIERQLDANLEIKYSDKGDKKKNVEHDIRYLLSWLLQAYWLSGNAIKWLLENSSWAFYKRLKSWWVKAEDFDGISYDDLLDINNVKWNRIIKKYVGNMLGENKVDSAVDGSRDSFNSLF
jgi:hypothetical protein